MSLAAQVFGFSRQPTGVRPAAAGALAGAEAEPARAARPGRLEDVKSTPGLVTAGDNRGRLRSEASFAGCCGAAPIPVSPGGSAGAGCTAAATGRPTAPWRIALVRMGCHLPTKDYVARRTAEGRTKTEIMCCLTSYIAREVFPHLLTTAPGAVCS